MNRFPHSLCICLALFLGVVLSACDGTLMLRGVVVDVRGQALPGVAVCVKNTEYQAVTNGRGEYSLRCAPGAQALEFIKTGYTPGALILGQQHIEAGLKLTVVDVAEVQLWPLPGAKGVYVYEENRYKEMARIAPKRYRSPDGLIYGTKKTPEASTTNPSPFIICHKLPEYDVTLCRLEQTMAAIPQQGAQMPVLSQEEALDEEGLAARFPEKVWVAERTIPVLVEPMDEPGHLLLSLRPVLPLEPGFYAFHWGALQGHTSIESRIFLFEIAAPEAQAESQADVEGDVDGESVDSR